MSEQKNYQIKVGGMSCQHCANSVSQALQQLPTVKDVVVELDSGVVRFRADGQVDMELVRQAITDIGFDPE